MLLEEQDFHSLEISWLTVGSLDTSNVPLVDSLLAAAVPINLKPTDLCIQKHAEVQTLSTYSQQLAASRC